MKTQAAKLNMLKQQLRTWGVLNEDILELYANTAREQFVPPEYQALAYADCSIPLDSDHFLLPPKESALMLQALAIENSDVVLELGTSSGFHTALLAQQAQHVISVDQSPAWIKQATANLESLDLRNIELHCQDPLSIQPEQAINIIFVGASWPNMPKNLLEQLCSGGRFCGIIGHSPIMEAVVMTKQDNGQFSSQKLFETTRPRLAGTSDVAAFEF